MKKIEVIRDRDIALEAMGASHLLDYLNDVTYDELVSILGEPTFDTPSGDGKVQKEWVVYFTYPYELQGDKVYCFTIYDWKTYDEEYTITENRKWNIGGHSKLYGYELIEFIYESLNAVK